MAHYDSEMRGTVEQEHIDKELKSIDAALKMGFKHRGYSTMDCWECGECFALVDGARRARRHRDWHKSLK